MKLNKIEVSYNYRKFENQDTAELLGVEPVSRTELSQDAVDYNTRYAETKSDPEGKSVCGFEYSHLPNGTLLILTFLGNDKIPFTIVKPHKDATWMSYRSKVGERFKIVVKEGKNNASS